MTNRSDRSDGPSQGREGCQGGRENSDAGEHAALAQVVDDAMARERIVGELRQSFLVEAAAGTGKTTILVRRLVAMLREGEAQIGGIVAVTFTNKAAGELKLRLRQELDVARTDAERRGLTEAAARLGDAIAHLEEAHIGTIHAFCAEILRERPVEARVDPAFREIDEEEATRLYNQGFQTWIEAKLGEMPEGLTRALSRLALHASLDGLTPLARLRDAGRRLLDWRDFAAVWTRREFARERTIEQLQTSIAALAKLHRDSEVDGRGDGLRGAIEPARSLDEWIRSSIDAGDPPDLDTLEARLLLTLRELKRNSRMKGRGSWPVEGLSRADVATARDELIAELEAFKTEADADLAALLRSELGEVISGYEELKHRAGYLDFLDLLLKARALIVGDRGVRTHLQRRFSHILVDEFQDTDPLQLEILLVLGADDPAVDSWRDVRPAGGKLFLVGDPKQSIYRFRRADVVLYEEVKERLVAAGMELLYLSRSFRSVPDVQAAVNGAFAPLMLGDRTTGQPDYVPLESDRENIDGQPAVLALPVPEPYGTYRVTKKAVDEGQPEVIAALVRWLVRDSGWQVHDKASKRLRDVEPRDIALLFRRFVSWNTDVTRRYTHALEARGIPHLLAGGRSFHQREEVETLRAALTAIEWPDDELSVFATLRGGFFAISDAALLRFQVEVGSLHPFRPLAAAADAAKAEAQTPQAASGLRESSPVVLDAELEPIRQALQLLAHLHAQRNRVPIAQTIHELLSATRAHAGLAMRPAGNQVLANVQRVSELGRGFDVRGGLSFRGFVQRLTDEAERPGSTESPVLEEGADGVRIMTVHGAKGLEFPIVVLADITANLTHAEPGVHIDSARELCATRVLGCSPWELVEAADLERSRDAAEGVRLAYVAATRARDLLVVPAIGDKPWEGGWCGAMNPAIYPARESWRQSERAPGCPEFGSRSVLSRPQRAHGEVELSVAPGLHESEVGTKAVWWDPSALELGIEGNFGLRQEQLLADVSKPRAAVGDSGPAASTQLGPGDDNSEPAVTPSVVAAGSELHERWQSWRKTTLESGASPEIQVIAASEASHLPPGPPPSIEVLLAARPQERPSGRRFGTLVHTVLRDLPSLLGSLAVGDVPVDAPPVIGDLTRFHARLLGAPADEVKAAIAAVEGALGHELVQRAAASAEVHRELPFLLRPEPRFAIEGILDMAFREAGTEGWTIVDFKTDDDVEHLAEHYRVQMAWYVSAVEQLLGGPVRAVLLAI